MAIGTNHSIAGRARKGLHRGSIHNGRCRKRHDKIVSDVSIRLIHMIDMDRQSGAVRHQAHAANRKISKESDLGHVARFLSVAIPPSGPCYRGE